MRQSALMAQDETALSPIWSRKGVAFQNIIKVLKRPNSEMSLIGGHQILQNSLNMQFGIPYAISGYAPGQWTMPPAGVQSLPQVYD